MSTVLLNRDVTSVYMVHPDDIPRNDGTGEPEKLKEPALISKFDTREITDADGNEFYLIENNNVEDCLNRQKVPIGMVKKSDFTKVSAYDWEAFGFKTKSVTPHDFVFGKPKHPFLKEIWNELKSKDKIDKKLDFPTIARLLRRDEGLFKLSRWVCKHASEWADEDDYKEQIKQFMEENCKNNESAKEVARKKYERLEAKIANLAWWNEIKADGFPSSSVVYHFHPVAFLEQMKRIEMNKPEWLIVAEQEAKRWAGKTEVEISKTINYHQEVGINLSDMVGTNHAWCASFVNYCIKQSNYPMFSPACRAKSVHADSNFVQIDEPIFGCIGLIGTHHVGFVYALNEGNKRPIMLGGNQSDQINFTAWHGALTYYIPKGFSIPKNSGLQLSVSTAEKLNEDFGIFINKKKGDITR